ncbi:MAG: 5-methyltetrahydrofolate--homocysteine methyltransferase [Nitrospirae bacterium]|nr:MAG: 5-methyltetrahydrofolate--homocysteine methyltransferase [Nitrospirota bacterium]
MIVIAENLHTRNKKYMEAVKKKDSKAISRLSKELADAGAEVINVQCSLDGSGDAEALPMVVEAIVKATGLTISLDSRNIEALKKAIPLCNKPPLINYLSATEPSDRKKLLSLVADKKTNLVLRASKNVVPSSLEAKLQILGDLLEEANAADIPNERLFADPSVVHIGKGMGQDHLINSHDCIRALTEMVEPPINTIAWISNVSAGMPGKLQPGMNSVFLSYLAGAGLDAAMVDVLNPEIRKTIYMIKSFRDEVVFSPADIS